MNLVGDSTSPTGLSAFRLRYPAGVGVRLNLRRAVALFAECRLQRVLGLLAGATEPKMFLPLTVGLTVGSR